MRRLLLVLAVLGICAAPVYAQDLNTLLVSFINAMRGGKIVLQGGTAPTVSSCGTGAVLAGSKDAAGQVTATGATSCVVVFAAAWANAPFCVVENLTANRGNVSEITTAQMTVSNLTDGDVFQWLCVGF